jgi:hypothetical protein
LYPDALVAQVLAASTYPAEIVEVDRWMQAHRGLKDQKLADEVGRQPWDPSVKALTQFPSVLENMDKNLSWTSSLGDAYLNQQQDVTDAIQAMRQQARQAGKLTSNDQQKVTTQGSTIIIEPANPEVVYVPAYDPWLVYGVPIVAYPGWVAVPGIYYGGPSIFFGSGFGIGFFGGYGWGWNHWDTDWRDHHIMHDRNEYVSHSRSIINRHDSNHGSGNFNQDRGGFNHGQGNFNQHFGYGNINNGDAFHGGAGNGNLAPRGSSSPHAQPGIRSGALSGFDHGGNVQGFSSRGHSSVGGGFHGGGFHGGGFQGGGGFHGGGGHGGGGHGGGRH